MTWWETQLLEKNMYYMWKKHNGEKSVFTIYIRIIGTSQNLAIPLTSCEDGTNGILPINSLINIIISK